MLPKYYSFAETTLAQIQKDPTRSDYYLNVAQVYALLALVDELNTVSNHLSGVEMSLDQITSRLFELVDAINLK